MRQKGGGMVGGKGEGVKPGLLRKKGVGEKGVVEYRWGRVFFFSQTQTQHRINNRGTKA